MAICKATIQHFDNRLESHWVSLVSTVFRRVVRPICVVFLPLEKSPGGFCFQVPFRIRFPKPPWNPFYSKILPVIASFCLDEVPTTNGDIRHQSNFPTIEIQLTSDVRPVINCNTLFPRLILMISIPFREQFAPSNNFLSRLRRFDRSGQTTLIQPRVRLLVMGNTFLEDVVEIGGFIDLFGTLGLTWRIFIRRLALFGIFLCGFQTHRNMMRWDLLMVRQVLRSLSERFIRGNLYHNIGFNTLALCLQNGQMRTLAQWLGIYEFQEIKEPTVANEQRCIRCFKNHGLEPLQTTYYNFLLITVMRKAFRSFIYMMIACYECMKRGLNRFILLPVRLLLESRVTSTSSSKLGFNFLYLFQWLYLNGSMYHVSCKTFLQ